MSRSRLLDRRVTARKTEDEYEEEGEEGEEGVYSDEGSGSDDGYQDDDREARRRRTGTDSDDEAPSEDELEGQTDDDSEAASQADSGAESESESESDSPSEAEPAAPALSNISFGALAKAQASLGKRKRAGRHHHDGGDDGGDDDDDEDEEDENDGGPAKSKPNPLDAVRNQLLALRAERAKQRYATGSNATPQSTNDHTTTTSSSSSSHKRSSKHAPMAMSTKYAVTRKRTVVEPLPAPKARDPRFDSAVLANSLPRAAGALGNAADVARSRYGFLAEYRQSELAALRRQLAAAKGADERDALQRQITSMADRQRAAQRKEAERRIRAEHKKRERELIREGKKSKAYYLKDSEVKKQAQVARFQEMSGRQRQKALEHRRKKMASKERREMPSSGLEAA
ncbi:rRNA biogenesis protein rrp36, partial [Ascosphaera acerosa]